MDNQGFYQLPRSIRSTFLWEGKFDLRSAFIDLLLDANHTEGRVKVGNKWKLILRGETWTAINKLVDRWGINKRTVIKYLNILSDEGFIYYQTTPYGTWIKILVYDTLGNAPLDAPDVDSTNATPFEIDNAPPTNHCKYVVSDTKNTESVPPNAPLNTLPNAPHITPPNAPLNTLGVVQNDTPKMHTNNKYNNNNNNDNNNNNNNNDSKTISCLSLSTDSLIMFYEENVGMMQYTDRLKLIDWTEQVEEELIREAIIIAKTNGKAKFSYINGILNNLYNDGITTLEQYKAKERERQNNIKTMKEEDSNGEAKDDEPFGTFEKMYGRDYGRFVKEGELDNLPF